VKIGRCTIAPDTDFRSTPLQSSMMILIPRHHTQWKRARTGRGIITKPCRVVYGKMRGPANGRTSQNAGILRMAQASEAVEKYLILSF